MKLRFVVFCTILAGCHSHSNQNTPASPAAAPAPKPTAAPTPSPTPAANHHTSDETIGSVRRLAIGVKPLALAHEGNLLYVMSAEPHLAITVIDIASSGREAVKGNVALPNAGRHPEAWQMKLIQGTVYVVMTSNGEGTYRNTYYQVYAKPASQLLDAGKKWIKVGSPAFFSPRFYFDMSTSSPGLYLADSSNLFRMNLNTGQVDLILKELPPYLFTQTAKNIALFSAVCCNPKLVVIDKASGEIVQKGDAGEIDSRLLPEADRVSYMRTHRGLSDLVVTLGGPNLSKILSETKIPLHPTLIEPAGAEKLLVVGERPAGSRYNEAHIVDRKTGADCFIAGWSRDDDVTAADPIVYVAGKPARAFIAPGSAQEQGLVILDDSGKCLTEDKR